MQLIFEAKLITRYRDNLQKDKYFYLFKNWLFIQKFHQNSKKKSSKFHVTLCHFSKIFKSDVMSLSKWRHFKQYLYPMNPLSDVSLHFLLGHALIF